MRNKALTSILAVSVLGNLALVYVLLTRDGIDYKAKYAALKTAYVSLATQQKYLFEVFMKAQADLKSLMPEYKEMTKDQYDEAMRRKIIKLEIEIKEMGQHE